MANEPLSPETITAGLALCERATRERPILFSGPMVQALLDGRKTQTRRICKDDPGVATYPDNRLRGPAGSSAHGHHGLWTDAERDYWVATFCPYGRPGDALWVREAFASRVDVDWATHPEKAKHYAIYRADMTGDPHDENNWHNYGDKWRPSIHMPRCLSRLTLELTDVRVERIQDISPEDAAAEGRSLTPGDPTGYFPETWNKVNGPGAWERNDWVWALTFRRVEAQ